ncbi:MAG TPA: enoyl-CoA hydratase/isomerase family protein [Acidimicrobiales bacterium]|jgi:enoyl-CoA hydratase/carnithine racemase|nr:enoyl-CoA hydratase/isomerase family protein [Acidimicrobiales bacterium]
MIDLTRDGDVFILRLDDDENRLSPGNLDTIGQVLHEVEDADGPKALVTVGTGKFFSNGLDLDYLGANPSDLTSYLFRVHSLFTRLLSMPCATVAAQNGHTFAAGAMLAICHDHRVMREDRGYWCLPEVDLGMPFTEGMNALIPARVPPMTAHEAMVTGRRYTGPDALAAGIVNELAAEDQVLPRAVEVAASLASKAGPGIAGIRTHLHAHVIGHLQGNDRS